MSDYEEEIFSYAEEERYQADLSASEESERECEECGCVGGSRAIYCTESGVE